MNSVLLPKYMFLTKGIGVHRDKLQSFELALRDAGIERCNIVNVSSILPPKCKIISREEGEAKLVPGEITFCVLSKNQTNEPKRYITAAIGVAVPTEKNKYGYISEYHAFGETENASKDYAEDMAATMLATTLGIPFDPDKAWNERRQQYITTGKIINTHSICQAAIGDKDGRWTTAIAAAVFLLR